MGGCGLGTGAPSAARRAQPASQPCAHLERGREPYVEAAAPGWGPHSRRWAPPARAALRACSTMWLRASCSCSMRLVLHGTAGARHGRVGVRRGAEAAPNDGDPACGGWIERTAPCLAPRSSAQNTGAPCAGCEGHRSGAMPPCARPHPEKSARCTTPPGARFLIPIQSKGHSRGAGDGDGRAASGRGGRRTALRVAALAAAAGHEVHVLIMLIALAADAAGQL